MVMPRSNDAVVEAFSPATGLRFVYADVTGVARKLATGHELSPVATTAFSRILACTALMQVDFVDDDETLVVSADLGGSLGGFHVEFDGRGLMRGYPFEKSPETLARAKANTPDDVFGDTSRVKVTRMRREGHSIRSQMTMETPHGRTATPEFLVAELLSSAIPSRVCSSASEWNGMPERVRALAAQRVPAGSEQAFKRVCDLVDDGTVAEQLASDPTLDAMRDVLDLPDLFSGPTRSVSFGCSCSESEILTSWIDLSHEELAGMARPMKPRIFRCHLCGRKFEISPEKILAVKHAKASLEKNGE